eukprot:snap_masked-scaffold1635_size32709-processed-gene-0.6 protein:Tk07226 transcript:snap_masked-scaffold1635_size32709-processed-gene-0.6-mRNA-1 annotation:"lysosomal-trafficking regulator-like"
MHDRFRVFGLSEHSALVRKYSSEASFVPYEPALLIGAALIQASPQDGQLRAKIKKTSPPEGIKHFPRSDRLTQVASDPFSQQIWVGFESGKILVFNYSFDHVNLVLETSLSSRALYAHTSTVSHLEVCHEFGLLLSGSTDRSVILWDKEDSGLIRCLDLPGPLECLATSRTSGDIALSSGESSSSQLSLYTINGKLVASISVEPVLTSLCFSSCPEGVSVNAVATGHANGNVRLWSSWDLSPITDIPTLQTSPITALAFNLSNQNLFVATQGQEVIVYEKSQRPSSLPPADYVHLTSLH